MNRVAFALCLALLFTGSVYAIQGTSAGTVLSNDASMNATVSGVPQSTLGFDPAAVVGQIYGLGGFGGLHNAVGSPGLTLRTEVWITNNGNDADADARIFVTSYSNQPGYAWTPWSYTLEVNGAEVGTNFAVPYAIFGEGAILRVTLLVTVPANTPTNSIGYFTIAATTSNVTGHVAEFYTGYNGFEYGGTNRTEHAVEVRLIPPNRIIRLYAEDGIDTISVFDGSQALRKSMNSIYVEFASALQNPVEASIWFGLDTTADGAGGSTGDEERTMEQLGSSFYRVRLLETELADRNAVSFLIEADGNYYDENYVYNLRNLSDQGFQTIIMGNVISPGETPGYVKLPVELVGAEGSIEIYSIAGDRVRGLLDGIAEDQVYEWDGTDESGSIVEAGMYFMAIKFDNFREIRKFFVTRQR